MGRALCAVARKAGRCAGELSKCPQARSHVLNASVVTSRSFSVAGRGSTPLPIGHEETRLSAYLCVDCARKQTIINLLVTALLGWWSFPCEPLARSQGDLLQLAGGLGSALQPSHLGSYGS